MTTVASGPRPGGGDPTRALRALRADRRRAVRAVHSLGDQIYPYYLGALLAVYVGFALDGLPDITVDERPIADTAGAHAAIHALGSLFVVLAVITVMSAAVRGIDGGPVVLAPEDGKVLLTLPIPRRLLVRRALRAAWARSISAGAALGIVALVVEVGLLGRTAASCALSCLVVPPVVAALCVAVGWLVELTPTLHTLVRRGALVCTAALLALAGYVAHAARSGPAGFWNGLARAGRVPGPWTPGEWVSAPGVSYDHRLAGWAIIALLTVGTAVMGLVRSDHIAATELVARSGRATAIRAAIFFADTSTLYLSRTRRSRMRHRRRWAPSIPGAIGALITKAGLQQQGTNPSPALILAACVTTGIAAAALHAPASFHLTKSTQLAVLLAAVALAAVGSRYADPLRLDLDRPDVVGQLPASYRRIIAADLTAPWAQYLLAVVLAAVVAPFTGLVHWNQTGVLVVTGLLSGALAISSASIAIVIPNTFGLLAPQLQLGLKLIGVVPAAIALEVSTAALQSSLAAALVALALSTTCCFAITVLAGQRAMRTA